MTASTTHLGERRNAALERAMAMGRHPTRRAVTPSGPPPRTFYLIAATAFVLTLLGLVMVLSATSISEVHKGHSPFRIFGRQLMWAAFGGMGLLAAVKLPLRTLQRLAMPLFIGVLALMLLPFVPHLGTDVNGASSWVAIGNITFQPSEFMKLALLVVAAATLADLQRHPKPLGATFGRVMVFVALACGICVVQGDLGSAIVIAAIGMAVVFLAGVPMLPIVATSALGVLLGFLYALTSQRRRNRFVAFLDCAGSKSDLCYQTSQAMIATAQGGITGSGVGQGHSKLGELVPLAHSDFIFSVVAEELGMIGVIAVLGGFLVLSWAGVKAAMGSSQPFNRLLAGGIVAWFVLQAFINVGGVTRLLPVTGLTLPFISAGGSSLFVTLVATGILLNVARNAR